MAVAHTTNYNTGTRQMIDKKDAFDFATKSFRLVRLLSKLQDAWVNKSACGVGKFLEDYLKNQNVGNLNSFSFVNQQTLLAHLYMVVVWYVEHQKKALFENLFKGIAISEIDSLNKQYEKVAQGSCPCWPMLDETIKKWDKKKNGELEERTLVAYLGHLRNAVSHGRVEFVDDNNYRFYDQYPNEDTPHTCLEMSFVTAGELADALYFSLSLDVYPPSGVVVDGE